VQLSRPACRNSRVIESPTTHRIPVRVPEPPVFASDRGRRRHALRFAGLTCAVLVAIWIAAVVVGALGDRLPGLTAISLKPSVLSPSTPARVRKPSFAALTTPARHRSAPASTPAAAIPPPVPATATTTLVSYTPAPHRAAAGRIGPRPHARRHAAARHGNAGGHRPRTHAPQRSAHGRHTVRRTHRARRVTV
jgi:hypothetical protein